MLQKHLKEKQVALQDCTWYDTVVCSINLPCARYKTKSHDIDVTTCVFFEVGVPTHGSKMEFNERQLER